MGLSQHSNVSRGIGREAVHIEWFVNTTVLLLLNQCYKEIHSLINLVVGDAVAKC